MDICEFLALTQMLIHKCNSFFVCNTLVDMHGTCKSESDMSTSFAFQAIDDLCALIHEQRPAFKLWPFCATHVSTESRGVACKCNSESQQLFIHCNCSEGGEMKTQYRYALRDLCLKSPELIACGGSAFGA